MLFPKAMETDHELMAPFKQFLIGPWLAQLGEVPRLCLCRDRLQHAQQQLGQIREVIVERGHPQSRRTRHCAQRDHLIFWTIQKFPRCGQDAIPRVTPLAAQPLAVEVMAQRLALGLFGARLNPFCCFHFRPCLIYARR
jgi:hypothetical protein